MPTSFSELKPITFKYKHDADLNVKQAVFGTQQGLSLNLINGLSSYNDSTILNYSNIYLTGQHQINDVINVPEKQPLTITFPTYVAFNAYPVETPTSYYLAVSSDSSTITFTSSLSDTDSTYFGFNDIDGLRCRLTLIVGDSARCLTVDNSSLSCFFTTVTQVTSADQNNLFDYSLDSVGVLQLFWRNGVNFYKLARVNNSLSAVNVTVSPFTSANKLTTTYVQRNGVTFNNDFIYYDKNDVSNFNLNANATVEDVPNNYVFHYSYESDKNMDGLSAYVDFFKAKNTLSKNYFVNDKLATNDQITQRNYTTILSKNNSEVFNGDLQLNFTYPTQEHLFKPDTTTKFVIDNLQPFTSLNINDSNLVNAGAYGGYSPLYADKVYKLLNPVQKTNEANGTLLHTWLYTDTQQTTAVWLDRYYNPAKNTIQNSLTGQSNYVSALSTYLDTNYAAADYNYYDIRSSLTFEPSGTYYYSRIGPKYVKKVTSTYSVLSTGMSEFNEQNVNTGTNESVIIKNTYGKIDAANTENNSFALSFKINAADINNIKSNLIIGNYFDEGFSIYKHGLTNIFTPGYFVTTPSIVSFFDIDNNLTFTLNLSTFVGSPVKILDIINTGMDHILKIFYVNQTNNFPGLFEFNLSNNAINKFELPGLQFVFDKGICGKAYYANGAYIEYSTYDDVTFTTSTALIDFQIGIGYGVTFNSNMPGSYVVWRNDMYALSGRCGVVLDNFGVSKDKNVVYFKNLSAGVINSIGIPSSEYASLCVFNDAVYDLQVYKDALFVQTKNKVLKYDSTKTLLNTYSCNTSAVSGLKLDFINTDFDTKMLAFTVNLSGYIVVDKFNIETGVLETSFNTGISADPQYYIDVIGNKNGLLQAPTNFAVISKLNDFDVPGFTFSYLLHSNNNVVTTQLSKTSFTIANESTIAISVDTIKGVIRLFRDGILIANLDYENTNMQTSHYLKNNFGIGMPIIDNKAASTLFKAYSGFASDYTLSNFTFYKKYLNDDEIKFDFLANNIIQAVNFDLPAGTRNQTDTVTAFNKMGIPGRKNNNVKLYIKNLNLDAAGESALSAILQTKLLDIMPLTTSKIELVYINNE